MTKAVTKDRILRAIESVELVRDKKLESDGEIIDLLVSYGLKSLVGGASELERNRMDIEFAYLNAPTTKEELYEIKD